MSKSANGKIDPEWINLAWRQASRIHHDEEVVKEIVYKACSELPLTSTKQSKRRFAKTREPKRINLERANLLQHLGLLHSEQFEIAQETHAPDSVSEGDMINRYLAFIVRKSMKRNSLYAVTGRCRLICNYRLKDVRTIHRAVLDDPDYYKDDDVLRKNKQALSRMVFERFHKHLRMEETQNGKEKHFILRKDQTESSLIRLVNESLDIFKPWFTECLSALFASRKEEQPIFAPQDGPDARELKRVHTLIHPYCFSIFTRARSIDAPDTRLGIPQFFFVNRAPLDDEPGTPPGPPGNGGDDGGDGGDGSHRDRMLEDVKKRLSRQAERMRRFIPQGALTVRVDGRDAASFDLDVTDRVQFTIDDEEAERIEIVARREQVVLAVHLLDDDIWRSQNRESFYTVRHESGARLTFVFRPITDADTGDSKLSVTLIYAETRLRRSLALLGRRLKVKASSLNPAENNPQWAKPLEERKPPWVGAVLLAITLSIYLAVNLMPNREPGNDPRPNHATKQ